MIALLLAAVTAPPLLVLDVARLLPSERVLAQSIQGIANRKGARVWIESPNIQKALLEERPEPKLRFTSVWRLLDRVRPLIKGAILYKDRTPSINVATSLCGPMDAVALDQRFEERANLKILIDATTMSEADCFLRYKHLFSQGIVVEQKVEMGGSLRDFAVKHNAFVMDTKDGAFRQRVIRELGPNTFVFGWGRDEYQWISDISAAGGTGVASDWCMNLSALESMPARIVPPKVKALSVEDGVRYVAFVLSDGDNLSWLTGDFATAKWYGSPLRGTFPMTWEISPLLSAFAPTILQNIYATAKEADGFIAGPGSPGYFFPHAAPNRKALATQAAPYLRESGLSTVSILNQNEGSMSEAFPYLDLTAVKAVVYKDYSPYNRRKGAIEWRGDKPCIAYRFVLWDGLTGVDDLANQIGEMPATPLETQASYALINVHAWSFNGIGGPIQAVKRVIDKLPPNTRVVTANQLIDLLKKNRPKG